MGSDDVLMGMRIYIVANPSRDIVMMLVCVRILVFTLKTHKNIMFVRIFENSGKLQTGSGPTSVPVFDVSAEKALREYYDNLLHIT